MQNIQRRSNRERRAAGAVRAKRRFAALALVFGLGACDNPLDTIDPDIVRPGDLQGPEAIPTLVQGSLADFTLAYAGAPIGGGSTEGIVTVTGLFTDEFVHSGTFTSRAEIETREIDVRNSQLTTVFRNLQRARRSAENAADFIRENGDDPETDARVAQVRNLAGLAYVYAAENFCSGVPFSTADVDGTLEFGEPLSTAETFQLALDRFADAQTVAQAAGSVSQEYMALLGQARVLLDMNDYAGAAALAALVPTGFRFELEHSINTAQQENGTFNLNAVFERWSIADGEGGNGVAFRGGGTMDIRIPFVRAGGTDVGFDRGTPQYDLLKYPGRDKSSTVATGVEARLIEAEAALQAGDAATWLQMLDDLRADVATYLTRDHLDVLRDQFSLEGAAVQLAPLTDPGTQDARVDLHFAERGIWLFATGSRLSDARRLIRQYGRDSETVLPSGAYFKGGVYGPDVNLVIPFDEENNPNFTGCLDRSA